jgi:endogenous inhibitor of DNA gyrase (YacG/DUF329 family)
MTSRPCKTCKKAFYPKYNNSLYCPTCKQNIAEAQVKICRTCGKKYKTKRYQPLYSKYCSIPCKNIGLTKTIKAHKPPYKPVNSLLHYSKTIDCQPILAYT